MQEHSDAINQLIAQGKLHRSKASRNQTYRYSQSSTNNSEQQYRPTSKVNVSTSSEEPSRENPLITPLFNSLLQYIMKPLTEKWKREHRGVKLAEHDPDTNLSSLRFADDIILISDSLKYTTTMLDDLTATTAHDLQPHSTQAKIIPNTTLKPRKRNSRQFKG